MQYEEDSNYREERRDRGQSLGSKLFWSLVKRIVLSPFVVFIVAYFYFGQDLRRGVLAALYFITAYTVILIIMKVLGILTSAVTFRPFSVVKKSLDLVIMVIILMLYYFLYSLWFQANFALF